MKVTSTILVLTLATATSFAQSAKPATQPDAAAHATKPATAKPAVNAAAQKSSGTTATTKAAATTAPVQKPAATVPPNTPVQTQAAAQVTKTGVPAKPVTAANKAKAVSKSAKKPTAAKKTVPAPQAEPAKPAEPKAAKTQVAGKRDPFISPVVNKIGGPSDCATGKKCLMVDQVRLQGTVRSAKGMIAMVVNGANKTYFLYENDPVFNGYVSKITADSIVFKETTQDRLGKPLTREVVKKVNTPAV